MHVRRDSFRSAECASQSDHISLAPLSIKYDVPGTAVAARKLAGVIYKIGAAYATLVNFLMQVGAMAEAVELIGGDQDLFLFEPNAEYRGCLQGLARLSAVTNTRVQRQECQPGRLVELRPFIGINEIARVRLRKDRCARRQDVLHAIDDFDLPHRIAAILELAMAHKTVFVAG